MRGIHRCLHTTIHLEATVYCVLALRRIMYNSRLCWQTLILFHLRKFKRSSVALLLRAFGQCGDIKWNKITRRKFVFFVCRLTCSVSKHWVLVSCAWLPWFRSTATQRNAMQMPLSVVLWLCFCKELMNACAETRSVSIRDGAMQCNWSIQCDATVKHTETIGKRRQKKKKKRESGSRAERKLKIEDIGARGIKRKEHYR